ALVLKTKCKATSKSRSFTSRWSSLASGPAANHTTPGWSERFLLQAAISFSFASGELSVRLKYTSCASIFSFSAAEQGVAWNVIDGIPKTRNATQQATRLLISDLLTNGFA